MQRKIKKEKILNLISWLFLAGVFISTIYILNQNIDNFITADDSSELILAKLLAEENSIMTTNWYYSTEIRVFSIQLIYAFFFHFTDNWHLVRMLSLIALHIIYLAAIFYFCKALKIKQYFPFIASFMILPFSDDYVHLVVKGIYYIPCIAITLVTIGVIEQIFTVHERKKQVILMIAAFILAVLSSMGGLRQISVLYLPLFVACVIDYLPKLKEKVFKSNWLLIAFILFIGSAIGYMINAKVLANIYHFKTWSSLGFVSFSFGKLEQLVNGFLSEFGYSLGNVLSATLILNFICGILILLIVFALVKGIKAKDDDPVYYRYAIFVVFQFVIFLLLYSFTDMEYVNRYYVPVTTMCIPLLFLCIEHECKEFRFQYALGTVLVMMAFVLSIPFYKYLKTSNVNDEYRLICEKLIENECYNGYSTFWNSNILTELTNGKIEVWDIGNAGENLSGYTYINESMFQWLQLTSHDTASPEGKVFLLLTVNEYETCNWKEYLKKSDLLYQSENYYLYCYESMDDIPDKMLIE